MPDNSLNYALLQTLTQAFGPSGSEDTIREIITREVAPFCDELTTDPLGNLIAVKKGTGKHIMVASHMDEIGLMITFIDDNGYLRFAPIGGVQIPYLPYRRVRFSDGTTGIIGVEKLDKPGDLKLEKLFIDIGASSRTEAEQMITIGSTVVFVGEYSQVGDHLTSKAMDDRIGCYVAIEALKKVQSPHQLSFVFTVQEEVGLRGAKTAAYALAPDFAFSVDVTVTGDTPKGKQMDMKLGKGIGIKVMDRSMITPPQIKNWMAEKAEEKGIPYQWEVLDMGGNDGGSILLTNGGIPTGVISIPTRYVHSPSEIVAKKDVEGAISLLIALLEGDTPQSL